MPLATLLGAASCAREPQGTTVTVSAIEPAAVGATASAARSAGERILAQATSTGLVAFDAAGQVVPGIAETWVVTDDGRAYIFRLRRMTWPDGTELTGSHVAASLNRAIARTSRNPLKPLLSAIDTVEGMTGRVVQIELRAPRPRLLQLLAQPELGIRRKGAGLGPWRVERRQGDLIRLVPTASGMGSQTGQPIDFRAEKASRAIARFVSGTADGKLVLGGTVADWPLVRVADIPLEQVRLDPVDGLFGLAVTGKHPLLSDAAARQALAMAIDRDRLLAAFDIPRWQARDTLMPAQLDSAAVPTPPEWRTASIETRQAIALQRIAMPKTGAPPPILRIALPQGPGMRLVFARIAADWRRIGVETEPVALNDPRAHLRLIDEVAPNTSANWYLTRVSCAGGVSCSAEAEQSLLASRAAATLAERTQLIAAAEAATVAHGGFIAIATPVRWSLVSPALTGWRENAMSVHPLDALRLPRR